MQELSKRFDEATFDIYNRAKSEANYNVNLIIHMVSDRGGLDSAKYLIYSPKPSDGYTALYIRGHLDLTVEAMVIENPKWHDLFTSEELAKARLRLKNYGYAPKVSGNE